jgi:hypothetical protein
MVRARLVAVAPLLACCMHTPPPRVAEQAAATVPPPSVLGPGAREESPGWTKETVRGCVTGFSGPTLNPGDAIRHAQAAALGEFAEAQGVRVANVTVDDGREVHSLATYVTEAALENVRVVAIETQRTGRADDATARVTHALACRLGSELAVRGTNAPAWVLDPRSAARAGEICAVGISGPTFDANDAPLFAARDAARALATVRQVLVSRTTADIDLRAYVILRSDAAVPEEAVTAALAASQERERWFDDEGRGPLALPRTTFVLRCMAR